MTERTDTVATIQADPRFVALVRRRGRLTALLSGLVTAAYVAFLLLVAFAKPLLARPVAGGVASLGIVLGLGLIALTILVTGLYVRRAATVFDPLVEALQKDFRS